MAGEPPKSLIQYFKKRHRRYPFKIKLLIPFTTHRNRSKYFMRILMVILIPRI